LIVDGDRIPEIDAMPKADIVCTGRNEPLIDPVVTEIALQRVLRLFVKIDGAIGARVDAALTSRARFLIENHDPVVSLRYRLLRTGFHAWRVVAVSADRRNVKILQPVLRHPRPHVGNPNELHPVLVFLFAGHFAGSAAPAAFRVNNQRICAHCFRLLQAFSG